DVLPGALVDLLAPYPVGGAALQLVEVHGVVLRRREQPHRHGDQPERQHHAPDGSRYRSLPTPLTPPTPPRPAARRARPPPGPLPRPPRAVPGTAAPPPRPRAAARRPPRPSAGRRPAGRPRR